jgi:hypothetical protein
MEAGDKVDRQLRTPTGLYVGQKEVHDVERALSPLATSATTCLIQVVSRKSQPP